MASKFIMVQTVLGKILSSQLKTQYDIYKDSSFTPDSIEPKLLNHVQSTDTFPCNGGPIRFG